MRRAAAGDHQQDEKAPRVRRQLEDGAPLPGESHAERVERVRTHAPNAWKTWEPVDDLRLAERVEDDSTVTDLAREFDRTKTAIRARINKLVDEEHLSEVHRFVDPTAGAAERQPDDPDDNADASSDPRDIICPDCGSSDLRGQQQSEEVILVTCQSCRHEWKRTPRKGCPRFSSRNITISGERKWISRDGEWHPRLEPGDLEPVEVGIGRCQKCHYDWSFA